MQSVIRTAVNSFPLSASLDWRRADETGGAGVIAVDIKRQEKKPEDSLVTSTWLGEEGGKKHPNPNCCFLICVDVVKQGWSLKVKK